MPSPQLQPSQPDQLPLLSETEQRALRAWQADPQAAPVADETAHRMMALFLRGYDCEAVAREFKGFRLGAVVAARLRHRWDEARDEYSAKLRASLIDQTVLVGLETARTAIDLLHCANRDLGEKARAHLAGNGGPPIKIESVAQYKTLIETVLKIVQPEPPPPVPQRAGAVPEPPATEEQGPLPPERQLAEYAAEARRKRARG